ncbi:phBC6A51 family helix-turn-helix protein [candidate division KSB1 bacterium]
MTPKKEKFISLLADPASDKDLKEIASELKVTVKTLYSWLAEPEILNKAYSSYISIIGSRLPKVLKTLLANAEKGDVNSIKLILLQTKAFQEQTDKKEYLTTAKALQLLDEYFEEICKNCKMMN